MQYDKRLRNSYGIDFCNNCFVIMKRHHLLSVPIWDQHTSRYESLEIKAEPESKSTFVFRYYNTMLYTISTACVFIQLGMECGLVAGEVPIHLLGTSEVPLSKALVLRISLQTALAAVAGECLFFFLLLLFFALFSFVFFFLIHDVLSQNLKI